MKKKIIEGQVQPIVIRKSFDVLYYRDDPHGKGKEFSHKYTEMWETTEYFCPNCGKQSVWFRNDSGDYYVGEQYICTACKRTFYLPDGTNEAKNEQDMQRMDHLLSAIMALPPVGIIP